jgi:chromosome segregation ATPase
MKKHKEEKMADELERADELAESQTDEESPPEVEEAAATGTRLEELEEAIAGKDAEIAALKQDKDELEDRLSALNKALTDAVSGYRTMVVQSNPDIVEELITGDTIDAVNESLEKAKALVSRVRQGLEAEISMAKVPAGAPERTPPDLSSMTAREKIQYAIGGFSS